MLRKRHLLSTIALIACTLSAADYCFPSPRNPAGISPTEIDQFITIIWNDNPNTGIGGTSYECDAGSICWCEGSCVGGEEGGKKYNFPSWIPNKNKLNIDEGDICMAWAMQLGVPMTFNMTTGLYLPVSNPKDSPNLEGWRNRESPLGSWIPNEADNEAGLDYVRYAASWGTEQEITDGDYKIQPPCYTIITNQALAQGHEIGNYTLDRMEPNSPLPGGDSPHADNGFARWDNEGFDLSPNDTTPWGEVFDEEKIYGYTSGMSALTMGWKIEAGRYISEKAWKGVLDISEEWLFKQSDMTKEKLFGFSAPRSEANSALFSALAEREYLYDCSLEEGMEDHRNGENFLWPYTVGNGSPNTWTEQFYGERRDVHEMPNRAGLWELPINCVIVPEGIRDSVWSNRAEILTGKGYEASELDEMKVEWLPTGKIKGSDFHTSILWGMRSEHWLKTMENTLQLRLDGNKAPFTFIAHSEFYGPNYDFNILLTDFYKKNWGLAVVKGWHDWESRIAAMEEWITWTLGKGCKYQTGKGLIDEIKKIQKKADWPGVPVDLWSPFRLMTNPNLDTKASHDEFRDSADITISIAAPKGNEAPYANYYTGYWDEKEISHISLDYQITNGALAIRLYFEGEPTREILLNNVNTKEWVHSGRIPISAFDFNMLEDPGHIDYDKPFDFSKLQSISIVPLAPLYKSDGSGELRTEPYEMSFKIRNLKIYSAAGSPIVQEKMQKENLFSIRNISKNALQLWIPEPGSYSISILSAQGRVVQQWIQKTMPKGTQLLGLNNLAKGVYLIEISDGKGKLQIQKKMKI